MILNTEAIPRILVFSEDLRDNKKDFTIEASDKERLTRCNISGLKYVYLKSTKTQHEMLFTHYKTDYDGSGEDIGGWRYRSEEGLELLIIND